MYKETYVKSDKHGDPHIIGNYHDPAMEPDVEFITEFSSDGKFLGMRKVRKDKYLQKGGYHYANRNNRNTYKINQRRSNKK